LGVFIDLTNQKFGKLTALSYERNNNKTYWICQCNCVHKYITKVRADLLKNGDVQSCGRCLENTYEFEENYVKVKTYNNKKEDVFFIDLEELNEVKKYIWYINENGYVWGYINGENILLHRFIMGKYFDIVDKEIDHMFQKTKDNRKVNLRICSSQENSWNKKYQENETGFKGVSKDKRQGNYRAVINYNDNKIELGTYKNLKDAIIVRVQAEDKYYKEFRSIDHDKEIEDYCGISIKEILKINIHTRNDLKIPILQFDKQNNFIKEWVSGKEAERVLNCNSQHIYACCKGKRKSHHGFIWRYKNQK